MEGIKKATTMELVSELMQRDDCYLTVWVDADVLEAFDRHGVEKPTPDQMASVWRRLDGWLEDRMCEVGWDVVDYAVREEVCEGSASSTRER